MPRLWLINQFANTPDLPGHTRQYEVAAGLSNSGWSVHVFSSDFNLSQRIYRRLRFPFLSITDIYPGFLWTWLWASPYRTNNWLRQLNMLSFCVHLFFRLLPSAIFSRLTGRSPDVILASSPQLPAAFVCLCVARLCSIPFALEVRDLWPQVLIDQGGKSPSNLTVRMLSWIEHYLYSNSSFVFVLAKGAESYVRARGATHTAWLPNGPDLQIFSPRPLVFDRSIFTVLYAGAHGDANALDNVIASARLLEKQQVPILFRFVGDGPQKQSLMLSAHDLTTVVFEDPVPKEQIPDLMAEADAILLSLRDVPLFRYGVSPNKLYDAYAIGRPVITTVIGSINSEVEQFSLGVTAPPDDPRALAEAIKRLINTSFKDRQGMAKRATELAQSIYSRQRIISQYDLFLRGLVSL